MKYIIVFSLLLISLSGYSQNGNYYLDYISKDSTSTDKAGSCASPDGPMYSIPAPPPSYAWLQANGNCNPASYGTTRTVCWTFRPTSSSVSINSGYSQTGCNNVSFGSFRLFNSACTQIGTGLNFTGLTPGAIYTWCMTGTSWGGGPGCIGFTDFCPYFTNNITLPVELIEFSVTSNNKYNKLIWITATEINNDYFTVYKSTDASDWKELARIQGAGNTSTPSLYELKDEIQDGVVYYKLKQTDYNGEYKYFNTIHIKNSRTLNKTLDYILLPSREEYIIYNITGNIILSGYENIIYINKLTAGIYIVKTKSITQKFIVQ